MITVCVNGFIAMGQTANGEFRNYHLPGGYGPSPMIAPFWDDLIIIGDAGIYKYYDAANHWFVVQYHKLRNGYNRTSQETFQVIFYDPLYHPTPLGDGMIKIQYKDFNQRGCWSGGYTPVHGKYCTVGIKDIPTRLVWNTAITINMPSQQPSEQSKSSVDNHSPGPSRKCLSGARRRGRKR
jgi:hypothetical protein